MAGFTNIFRQEGDTENPTLADAFGVQATRGKPVVQKKILDRFAFISLLANGECDGAIAVFWGGRKIDEIDGAGNRVWKFHKGTKSTGLNDAEQGRPYFWPELDWTFSEICYLEIVLPSNISEGVTSPDKLFVIFRGKVVDDYAIGGDGDLVVSGRSYSANNMRIGLHILRDKLKMPLRRFDAASWIAFRTHCDELISWSGGTLPEAPTVQGLANMLALGDGGYRKNAGVDATWNAGLSTTTAITTGNNGLFEVAAYQGTFAAGITTNSSPRLDTDFTIALKFTLGGALSFYKTGGVYTSLGTWAQNDVFRFAIEGGAWKIYKNGLPLDLSAMGALPAIPASCRGGITASSLDASVTRSRIYAGNAATPRLIPRFDAHVAFPSAVDALTAFEAIMARAPDTHWQDVGIGGKLKVRLLVGANRAVVHQFYYNPNQTIIRSNIAYNSFSTYAKQPEEMPTFLRFSYRDLDDIDNILPIGYVMIDRPDVRQALDGFTVDPSLIPLGVMRRSLAERIGECIMRVGTDLPRFVVVRGQANSHHVAKGDYVEVIHDTPNWYLPRLWIVVEESFARARADERDFLLQAISTAYYSDSDHGSIVQGGGGVSVTSQFVPPPVVVSCTLAEGGRQLPDGTWYATIQGQVQAAQHPYPQNIRVWWKSPSDVDYRLTDRRLTPDPVTLQAAFELDGAQAGTHYIKVVSELRAGGLKLPFDQHPIFSKVITAAGSPNPDPPSNLAFSFDGSYWRFTFTASPSPDVAFYRVKDENNNIIKDHLTETEWRELPTTGIIRRKVTAVSSSGKESAASNLVVVTILAPSTPAGWDYDLIGTNFVHSWIPNADAEAISRYEIGNSNFSTIYATAYGNVSGVLEIPPVGTLRTHSRYLRAVNIFGNASPPMAVKTKTFAALPAPTVTVDAEQQYPSSALMLIAPNVAMTDVQKSRIISTKIDISSGAVFPTISPMQAAGDLRSFWINRNISDDPSKPTLYTRARYVDVFGDGSTSPTASYTFSQFLREDIIDGAINSAKLALEAVQSQNIAAGALSLLTLFGNNLRPIATVSVLPSLPSADYPAGSYINLNQGGTNRLKKVNDAGTGWINAVGTSDIQAGAITANEILAATITGALIAAGTINASNLVVGNFNNAAQDPNFELSLTTATAKWNMGDWIIQTAIKRGGARAAARTGTGDSALLNDNVVDCREGDRFYIEGYVRATNSSAGGMGGVRIAWLDSNKAVISYNTDASLPIVPAIPFFVTPTNAFQYCGGHAVAPTGAAFARPEFFVSGQTSGTYYVDGMYFRKSIDNVFLADASIVGAKIVNATITAAQIGSAQILTAHIGNAQIASAHLGTAIITDLHVKDVGADKIRAATGTFGLLFADAIIGKGYLPFIAGYAYQDVQWKNFVGTAVDTNNTLSKTSGTSAWTAGADSTQTINNQGGAVRFAAAETNTYRMCGLSNTSHTLATNADLQFGIYTAVNGDLHIIESGNVIASSISTYVVGDIFEVAIRDGNVYYSKNGTVLYTHTNAVITYPLMADCSMFTPAGTIQSAQIRQFAAGRGYKLHPYYGQLAEVVLHWHPASLINVTDNGAAKLTKTGGGATGYDATAYSIESIAQSSLDGYVVYTVKQVGYERAFALSADIAGAAFISLDFAFRILDNNNLFVYENNVNRGQFGTVALGTVLKIAVEGGGARVVYYKDGVEIYRNSAPSITYPLYCDVAFSTMGAELENLRFASLGTGRGEFNDGIDISGVPFTEVQARATGAIDITGRYRGNDSGTLNVGKITSYGISSIIYIRDEDFVDVQLNAQIDGLIRGIPDDTTNADSVKWCKCTVRDKFGVEVFTDVWPYNGRGICANPRHSRKYADPKEEATYELSFYNRRGYSRVVYLVKNVPQATAPTYQAQAGTPLDLVASAKSESDIGLTWGNVSSGISIYYRPKNITGWTLFASGQSGTSATVTNLAPNTVYEFKVTASAKDSNIAVATTQIVIVTPAAGARAAPSNLIGTVVSSTQIDLAWTRNATDNTAVRVERKIGAGAFAAITPDLGAAVTTFSDTGRTAGTTYSYRLRNVWTTGTLLSNYSNEVTKTTTSSNPASSDPTSLVVTSTTDSSLSIRWTPNTATGTATIEYKVDGANTWIVANAAFANPASGDATSSISGLLDGTTYRVRVKNNAGGNYSNEALGTTIQDEPPDPYGGCVAPYSMITCEEEATGARYLKRADQVTFADWMVTINLLTGEISRCRPDGIFRGRADRMYMLHSANGRSLDCSATHPMPRRIGEETLTRAANMEKGTPLLSLPLDADRVIETEVLSKTWIEGDFPVVIFSLPRFHLFVSDDLVSHNIAWKGGSN